MMKLVVSVVMGKLYSPNVTQQVWTPRGLGRVRRLPLKSQPVGAVNIKSYLDNQRKRNSLERRRIARVRVHHLRHQAHPLLHQAQAAAALDVQICPSSCMLIRMGTTSIGVCIYLYHTSTCVTRVCTNSVSSLWLCSRFGFNRKLIEVDDARIGLRVIEFIVYSVAGAGSI